MGHDHPATRNIRRYLGQYRGHVFIRKAVEAVTPDAFPMEFQRERKGLRDFRHASVKRRIEAGDLRQLGIAATPVRMGARLYG